MTNARYEVTVHRLGGNEPASTPWSWSREERISTEHMSAVTIHLDPRNGNANNYLRVSFTNWEPGPSPDWSAATVTLEHMNGQPLGSRPVLVPARAWDVPVYVGFLDTWSLAVFSVGIRMVGT